MIYQTVWLFGASVPLWGEEIADLVVLYNVHLNIGTQCTHTHIFGAFYSSLRCPLHQRSCSCCIFFIFERCKSPLSRHSFWVPRQPNQIKFPFSLLVFSKKIQAASFSRQTLHDLCSFYDPAKLFSLFKEKCCCNCSQAPMHDGDPAGDTTPKWIANNLATPPLTSRQKEAFFSLFLHPQLRPSFVPKLLCIHKHTIILQAPKMSLRFSMMRV